MKIKLGLAVLFFISTPSFAEAVFYDDAMEENFTGPYVGVGIGETRQKVAYQYWQQYTAHVLDNLYVSEFSSHHNQYIYHAVFGYSLSVLPFYLGSEFSIGRIHGTFNTLSGSTLLKEQQKQDLTLSLLLGGFVTSSTLLYAQAGIGAARYELSLYDASINEIPNPKQQKNWTGQLIAGAGIEQRIVDDFSLRLVYAYQNATHITTKYGLTADYTTNKALDIHYTTYQPSNQAIFLDLIWRFDSVGLMDSF